MYPTAEPPGRPATLAERISILENQLAAEHARRAHVEDRLAFLESAVGTRLEPKPEPATAYAPNTARAM